MKLVFEKGTAYVPLHTPWFLAIQKNHEDLDLILHVGGCQSITLLKGSELRAAYAKADDAKLTGAFSEIIDEISRRFEGFADVIDLEDLAESTFCHWESAEDPGLDVRVNNQNLPESLPMWNGYSSAYVWGEILRHLQEKFGENVIYAWLHDSIPVFTEQKILIYVRNSFTKEVLERRCLKPIRSILEEHFQIHADIEILSRDAMC